MEEQILDRQKILNKFTDGVLIDAIFSEYGRIWLEDGSPTIAMLADMHDAGEIDVLGVLTEEAIERNRPNFFEGQHLYECLIPKISASVREMLRVVEALRVGGGDDLAAGLHIDKFATWCGAEPSRPADLLALIDEGVAEADSYLIIAIKTGVLVDRELFTQRAYGFLAGGSERQKWNALSALCQIDMPDDGEWDRLLAAMTAAQSANQDDDFRAQLISSIFRRLKGVPSARIAALEEMAATALLSGGEKTLHAAATALAFDPVNFSEGLQSRMLEALRGVVSANNRTIDFLDLGLSKLVKAGRVEEVREFVAGLVSRGDDPIRLRKLDSLVRALIEDPNGALGEWVVAWLRDGDHRLCSAMDRALFDAGRDERALSIDFSRFCLSDAEYPYIARKVVGSFFLKPLLMSSLLASLLRSAPAATVGEVEQVLINPVLQNYSGSTRNHLIPISEDTSDPAAPAVARAIAAQDAYLEGLKIAGRISELRPSERERQLEWERHSDSMSDAAREARKKSIFAQIATESVILYGRRAVSWIDTPGQEPRRIQTEMGSISTSFEMPRGEIIDPVGLQLMLMSFRVEVPPR